MADTDNMIHIAQHKFQELVGQDARSVGEPKQRVVRKDGSQAHSTGMQNRLVSQVAQATMAVHDFYALADDNVAEDGEEGEDGRERGGAVDDEERDMVDFEPVGQVAYACPALVIVRDDDDFVATVDQFA